nr:PIG-L deacetylase family protein [uncultured Holophaga sp.]
MASSQPSMLVVSAHAADFVWRAGGAIALHAEKGYHVKVVCLSYGERGESAKMWKQPGMDLLRVKAARRGESERAAEILGVSDIEFFDVGDYPMRVSDEVLFRLVDIYREIRPAFVLSHSREDIYNADHPLATRIAQEARIIAQAHGHTPEKPVIGAPQVYLFEPHQPEQCNWKPDVLLDISSVWEKKHRAFETMAAQEHLWEYYTRVALQRGAQAARNSEKKITYGEGYARVYPDVPEVLG